MFISVDFVLDPDEFSRGILAAFRRSRLINQAYGVLFSSMAVAAYLLDSARPSRFPSWPLIVLMAAAALYYFLQPLRQRLVLRRQYRKRDVRSVNYTFTDDGVNHHCVTRDGEHRSTVKWDHYVEIRETAEFFLLCSDRRHASLIPKRAFGSGQAELFSRFAEYGFAETLSAM